MAGVRLEPVEEQSLSYVENRLIQNDLPVQDVSAKRDCFYIGYSDGQRIGFGGIEPRGTDGLLRSIVVERAVRGQGIGTELCDQLEEKGRQLGIESCYILTTTAGDFFEKREYNCISREEAPEVIRETAEFSELCPAPATCMVKQL